jgi:hypothetical protein
MDESGDIKMISFHRVIYVVEEGYNGFLDGGRVVIKI